MFAVAGRGGRYADLFDRHVEGLVSGLVSRAIGSSWPSSGQRTSAGRRRGSERGIPAYTIAQAKEQLSKLVDDAMAGEDVTIIRDGEPVVELKRTRPASAGRPSLELIDRIAARAKTLPTLGEDAVDIIR